MMTAKCFFMITPNQIYFEMIIQDILNLLAKDKSYQSHMQKGHHKQGREL